jgi:hypothetical protein
MLLYNVAGNAIERTVKKAQPSAAGSNAMRFLGFHSSHR